MDADMQFTVSYEQNNHNDRRICVANVQVHSRKL